MVRFQVQSPVLVDKEKIVTINAISQSGEFYLKSPDKESTRIVPRQQNQNFKFSLNNINVPGIYHLMARDQIIASIPANPETYAIHQSFMDLNNVEELESVQIFSENDEFEESILQARFGSELWKFFIFFVLLLLGIELYIIKKMEGRIKKSE